MQESFFLNGQNYYQIESVDMQFVRSAVRQSVDMQWVRVAMILKA